MEYKVFVTRKLPRPGLEFLEKKCYVEVNPHDRVLAKEEIIEGLAGKDGLLCLLTDKIDREIISSNPGLKIISNYAVGYNNIDVAFATERKIPVTNTPGVLTKTTADLTWALILAVSRRIVEGDKLTRKNKFKGWAPEFMLGTDVCGKTLGIVGMGRIGKEVARRAAGFDMKILYNNNKQMEEEEERRFNAEFVSLERLLRESDFISLHVPLNEKTKYLIGEEEFAIMKNTSFLINTSRGEVLHEKALLRALENRVIAGAGLDVYEEEPSVTEGLMELENVVLLPHMGSASIETRTRMAFMAVENLLEALCGRVPPNIVNKEIYNK